MRHNNSKRSRGRGGRRSGSPSLNRSFDSNGPSGKLRGTPAQLSEKYQAMARDARAGRDRVLVESYFQHAEHYQRLANELAETQAAAAAENEQRQPRSGGRENEGGSRAPAQQAEPTANADGSNNNPKSNGADQTQAAPEARGDASERVEAPKRPPRRRRRPADDTPAKEAEATAETPAEAAVETAVDVEEEKVAAVSPVEAAG